MGCTSSDTNHVRVADSIEKLDKDSNNAPVCFHDKWSLGPKLGKGAFAQVRLASLNESTDGNRKVTRAVKIIDLRDKTNPTETNKQQKKAARTEATVWQTVGDHCNIIRLYEIFSADQLCYLVMEKCESSLLSALDSSPEYTEATLSRVVVQMLQALSHVHAARVVHRDVKPDNFLCGGEGGQTVKLGDFGLSIALPKVGGVTGIYGTAPFMCPEMLSGRWYNEKADVWSVGVIAYVLLFGYFPYMPKEQSSKAMKQAIVDGLPHPKYEPSSRYANLQASRNAVTFCKTLLSRDPERRPSSDEALTMPYMLQALEDEHTESFPEDLPSLRVMIHSAKKVGAFEIRDPTRDDRTDFLLNSIQMKHSKLPLPATSPELKPRRRSDEKKRTEETKCKDADFKAKNKSSRTPPPGCAVTAWDNASGSTHSTTCEGLDRDDLSSFKGSGWSKDTFSQTHPSSTISA